MSHVAEGLLHAHLDGALDAEGRREWSEAAAHLDVCEDCRRRLEEARAIRGAAAALLAGAAAEPSPRPAFEELAAAAAARRGEDPLEGRSGGPAETGAPPGRRHRATTPWWGFPMKLAWAASLVLAVGAGWIGRQLMIEQGEPVPGFTAGSQVAIAARDENRADGARTDGEGDADRAEEELAGAARPEIARGNERREAAENRAAPPETPVDEQAAAPEPPAADDRVGQVDQRAAKLEDRPADASLEAGRAASPRCYETASPAGEGAEAEGRERLRLDPNGTAALVLAGQPLVGFWAAPEAASRHVRVTDGGRWYELRLTESGAGLRGSLVAAAAAGAPQGEQARAQEEEAAARRRALDRLEGTVTFTQETCP